MSKCVALFLIAVVSTTLPGARTVAQTWTTHDTYNINLDNVALLDTSVAGFRVMFIGGTLGHINDTIKTRWDDVETSVKADPHFLKLTNGYVNLNAVSLVLYVPGQPRIYFIDGQRININESDYKTIINKINLSPK